TDPRRRTYIDHCRSARSCGFVRAVCIAGAGNASPDRADTESGGHGSLSLRAKSDLHRGRCCHFWSSIFIRRPAPPLVCRAALALFPRLGLAGRRTNAQGDIWGPVRGFPRQRPALDSTPHALAERESQLGMTIAHLRALPRIGGSPTP